MTTPAPEDQRLDQAMQSYAAEFVRRQQAQLATAAKAERPLLQRALAAGQAALSKVIAMPQRRHDRQQELASIWAALGHLTEMAQAQAGETQKLSAAVQSLATEIASGKADHQSLATAFKDETAGRAEVLDAVGGFHKDPQGANLAAMARHRQEDRDERKAAINNATEKWQQKREAMESDIASREKMLAEFNRHHEVEPDPIRRQALMIKLTELMTSHLADLDKLSDHIDARPH